MVSVMGHEHLGFPSQPTKRLGMDDPVAIALKAGAKRVIDLWVLSASAFRAKRRIGRQSLFFAPMDVLLSKDHFQEKVVEKPSQVRYHNAR